VLDLEIPSRVKRWAVRLGIPLLVLSVGAVAYAGLPKSWMASEKLTASDLNASFAVLDANSAKPGMIVAFGGPTATAPAGWLPCDGHEVSRTDPKTAALYSVIGTVWGAGDKATTFNLPDLRGRGPLGAGAGPGLTNRELGTAVGEENHKLTVAEMPSHSHNLSMSFYSVSGDFTTIAPACNNALAATYPYNCKGTTPANGPLSVSSTVGDQSHNTMQPDAVVNFLIKL
jgi:microcystin-dependent protein